MCSVNHEAHKAVPVSALPASRLRLSLLWLLGRGLKKEAASSLVLLVLSC